MWFMALISRSLVDLKNIIDGYALFANISGSFVGFESIHTLKGGMRRQLYFQRRHEESWLALIIMKRQCDKPLFQKMAKYNKIIL